MSKTKVEQKRWWVSRDNSDSGVYNLHHMVKEPKLGLAVFPIETCIESMTTPKFHELFTIRLRKGECKEIERPVLVLKKTNKKEEISNA